MFQENFRGTAHEDFIKGLEIYDQFYDRRIHFGRTIPLLQSSGTGKSRLVSQMGSKVRFSFHRVHMSDNAMYRFPYLASASDKMNYPPLVGHPAIHLPVAFLHGDKTLTSR
jgi:hypothetical protein